MGKPMAAEVPMAVCMATLHHAMNGTDSVPPPMPTRLDTPPMTLPMPNMPAVPGSSRDALGLMSSSICAATQYRKQTKKPLRKLVESWATTHVPSSVPVTMPGVMRHTTFHSTAPRLWCARKLEMEVNMMLAIAIRTRN